MEITLETLRRFGQEQGSVYIEDSAGITRKLRNGDADVWDLAEKANRFQYNEKWYNRADFAALMEKRLNPEPLDYRAGPADLLTNPPKKK